MIGGSLKHKEKVRKIFTQVVNSLTSKSEIGDLWHLSTCWGTAIITTNHKFNFLFIGGGMSGRVLNAWDENVENLKDIPDKVVINKKSGSVCWSVTGK